MAKEVDLSIDQKQGILASIAQPVADEDILQQYHALKTDLYTLYETPELQRLQRIETYYQRREQFVQADAKAKIENYHVQDCSIRGQLLRTRTQKQKKKTIPARIFTSTTSYRNYWRNFFAYT